MNETHDRSWTMNATGNGGGWRRFAHRVPCAAFCAILVFASPMVVLGVPVSAPKVAFVRSSSLAIGFDTGSGRAVKVVAADGTDLTPNVGTDLFRMQLTRSDDFSINESLSPRKAARFRLVSLADGLRLVWEDLDGKLSRVECTVSASPKSTKVRFGLAFWPTNGWAVTVASYPCINFSGRIGESAEDDKLLAGSKQGVSDNLASLPVNQWHVHPQQPGPLAVQTAFWWDPSLLIYTAAEDDKGDVKNVGAMRVGSGDMQLWWDRKCFDAAPVRLDYVFVFAAVCGTKDAPVTWHDGADIYREWARTSTRLCPVPAWKRSDIPPCLADAPVVTLFNRPWFNDIGKMRRWVDECWSRIAPGVPLVAICWGWEHYATWVHPHSFPCNPSDEAFASLVSDFAAKNVHAFPWPSGYNWTLSYGTNEAGIVQYDWRKDFMREVASHACITRDGKVVERAPYWLHGGAYAKMCGGDEWTLRWFSEDVTGELAKRGCMIVSVDQNNGGMFDPCWSRNHPHTPGEGRWKTDAARRQLIGMAHAIRKIHGKSAVTYEDPNEQVNDLSALQLQRDTKWKGEWASVYNYVYHEYMPMFQAEPRSRIDLRWMAYSAAEGQMPRIVPAMCDIENDDPKLIAQRKFEAWYPGYMKRWISLFRGEGRPFLAYGRRIKPPQIVCGSVKLKEGGAAPAVFAAAYESEDGRRALVLANATAKMQNVRCIWPGGKTMEFQLEPRDLRLVNEISGNPRKGRCLKDRSPSDASTAPGVLPSGWMREIVAKVDGRENCKRMDFFDLVQPVPVTADTAVELRIKCELTGDCVMYWRSEKMKNFVSGCGVRFSAVGDREVHTYVLRPAWKTSDRIVNLRIDFPYDRKNPGRQVSNSLTDIEFVRNGCAPFDSKDADGVMFRMKSDKFAYHSMNWTATKGGGAPVPFCMGFTSIPDGKMHTYWFDLRNTKERMTFGMPHWFGKIEGFCFRSDLRSCEFVPGGVEFVKGVPRIPADPVVRQVFPEDAIPRTGRPLPIEIVARNYGTEPAEGIRFALENLPEGVCVLDAADLSPSGAIAPSAGYDYIRDDYMTNGLPNERRFRITLSDPGRAVDFTAKLVLSANGGARSEKVFRVKVLPSLNLAPCAYPPEPKPLDTGGVEIGVFLFPGWSRHQWYPAWDAMPERKPVLGWYDDTLPQVRDWQIKWLVENGISYAFVDWYWKAEKGPSPYNYWIEGIAKARYRTYIKYAALWCNEGSYRHSEKDQRMVTQYWIDNFFADSQYLKIDGKPVVGLWALNMDKALGPDGARRLIAISQEMARAAGYPGIYFVSMHDAGENPSVRQHLKEAGADASFEYCYKTRWSSHWPGLVNGAIDYSAVADSSLAHWRALQDGCDLPFFPSLSTGWGNLPWLGDRGWEIVGKTPEKFAKVCRDAKLFSEETGVKRLLLGPFDEWCEGEIGYPNAEHGFGMLEAVREAFAKKPPEGFPLNYAPQDVGLGPYTKSNSVIK